MWAAILNYNKEEGVSSFMVSFQTIFWFKPGK